MKLYFGVRNREKHETNVMVKDLTMEELNSKTVDFDKDSHKLFHKVYHSPDGFEWGYGGSGPADLALSILYDYLDHDFEMAWEYHQIFKQSFVAKIKEDNWIISGEQIQRILDNLGVLVKPKKPTLH